MLAPCTLALAVLAADPQYAAQPQPFGAGQAVGRSVEIPAESGRTASPRPGMRPLVDRASAEVPPAATSNAPASGGAPLAAFGEARDPFADIELPSLPESRSPAGRSARPEPSWDRPTNIARRPETDQGALGGVSRGQSPSPGDDRSFSEDQVPGQTKEARQWSLLVFFLLASIGVNIYQWIWYMKMRLRQQSLLFRMHDRVESRDVTPDRGWEVEIDHEAEDRLQRRSA